MTTDATDVTVDVLTEHWRGHLAAATDLEPLLPTVARVATELIACYSRGGILYTFGNGGSAADAQHLAGEMIGRYLRERRPLPAVALSTDPSVSTCIANDYGYDDVFSRQVTALARAGDMVIGFSTSGTSPSVVAGLAAARAAGALTVLFTGQRVDRGVVADLVDIALIAPAPETARAQELHVLMLHMISDLVDRWAVETQTPAQER
ncbi:MAG TPA: SIS domain-containing protein [Actinopolymorphaceae bacterium]